MNKTNSISIIIPTLNEEQNIESLLNSLCSFRNNEFQDCEIIVADGGSTDNTFKLSGQADLFVQSACGRAVQQNTGAEKSSGNILLFLHADCKMQSGGLTAIHKMLADKKYVAGCFSQKIDHSARKYRFLEWGNRQRVRWFQSAYGDQGIFMTREIFEKAGRFPEVPFLEDLLLMKKIRKLGKMGILNEKIIISARRWEKTGVIKQTLVNRLFVILAHCGISPKFLAKYYPTVR